MTWAILLAAGSMYPLLTGIDDSAMRFLTCALFQVGVECVDNGWMSPLSAVHSCEVLSAVDVK